jgi:hypothetical protein
MNYLNRELFNKKALAVKKGLKLAIRLNVFSDISWENFPAGGAPSVIEAHSDLQFWDYTKSFDRMNKFINFEMPNNYHLTFSRSEDTTESQIHYILRNYANVAVVFRQVPETWLGHPVVNGDDHDYRFLNPPGSIIGLKQKARASKDRSGFVYE